MALEWSNSEGYRDSNLVSYFNLVDLINAKQRRQ